MKGRSTSDIIFVTIFAVLVLFYWWSPDFLNENLDDLINIISWIPMLIGAVLFVWAALMTFSHFDLFPTPREDEKLVTSGIYNYVRHPFYGGLVLLALGYGIYDLDTDPFKLIMAMFILLFFNFMVIYEEKKLVAKFGQDYLDYQSKVTGKLLPSFIRYKVKFEKQDKKKEDPEEVPVIEEVVDAVVENDEDMDETQNAEDPQ